MSDQHLFILGCNDSGTTFLQNSLSNCLNCVSFRHAKQRPHGIEGQGVSYWKKRKKDWYPRDIDHAIVKLFSEKKQIWQNESNFNWEEIKNAWNAAWKANEHFSKASPKIFLEKTPSSLFSLDMYLKHFPDAKFIILQRNPYAVCEGIRRTVKLKKKIDYSLVRCAKHWVQCTKQQINNINQLGFSCVVLKYEELVTKPKDCEKIIKDFVPALNDVDFNKTAMCHSMDGSVARPVTNFNLKHLRNLSDKDYKEINLVLEENKDILDYFSYTIRNTKP